MLLGMFRKIVPLVAILVTVPAAGALGSPPTPAQIHAALSHVERSRQLWATINICNTTSHQDQMGVRAQMPALGFPASLSMTIQVEYLAGKHFRPDPGVKSVIRLGVLGTKVHQAGHTFQFVAHAGLLTGEVTFQWRRAGKLLGHIARPTTAGHRNADFGDPPGHSVATCRIS
jgi:hypothetical protein